MAGAFDVDLVPKILSVDRKVRLSGIDKRREQGNSAGRGTRAKKTAADEPGEKDTEKQGTIDITV